MDEPLLKSKILRLVESDVLLSADVFEENFRDACIGFADLNYEHPQRWLDAMFGRDKKPCQNLDEARVHFQSETNGLDYISPGYGGFHLLPLLHLLRRNSTVRLLFIAHSPAQHVVEMALVSGRLRRGDVLICPSDNARQIIVSLFPSLEPFCVVIPHAIPPLSSSFHTGKQNKKNNANLKKLVSLCRIAEDKLIHRQLDALAILRAQGNYNVRMEIAGDTRDKNGKTLSYVNELKARAVRLGLEEHVVFRGAITCKKEKALFLQEADALLNLSRTEEESFGKSCAEAITLGVPVISTYWNGLPETVGECGTCVPLSQRSGHLHFDVDPQLCAEAIYKILFVPPPPETFIKQSRKFSLPEVSQRYKAALFGFAETCREEFKKTPLPERTIPVLRAFSREKLDTMYLAHLGLNSHVVGGAQDCERLATRWQTVSNLIFHTTRGRSKRLLAHLSDDKREPKRQRNNPIAFSNLQQPASDEWINSLLSSCLDKCDGWERGVMVSQLAVHAPTLLPWANATLLLNEQDNFQLIVAANCLSLTESEEDFQANFLWLLERRNFCENDAPILFYLYKQIRESNVFNELHKITGEWLKKYPDAPGSSGLWGMAGPRLIIETEDIQLRNSLLARLKAVLPKLDISRINLAHNAIDLL